MKKIKSFTVNHNKLSKGIYISRVDDNIVTYDIRMKKPNNGDYLTTGQMHTIEHIFATYVRNTKYENSIIYVGPMGCRTGFYLLVKDDVSKKEAIQLIKDTMIFIKDFEGEIPGATQKECGNYKDQDLEGAKKVARQMCSVIENWEVENLEYIR